MKSVPDVAQSQPGAAPITMIRAARVVPIDRPAFADGAVAFSGGRILGVGPAAQLIAEYPGAVVLDRQDAVLLPGLVNAHVHLELSALRQGPRPASFVDWLMDLIPAGPSAPEAVQERVARSVADGVAQCLRFGVTSAGEISRQCALARPLLARTPLRVVSYGEVQAMAQRRALLDERIALAADASDAGPNLQVAISPHAPYSIERHGYEQCLALAQSQNLPLATHLAESSNEAEFLAHHAGPFRALWERLGAWDAQVPTFAGGPIRFAQAIGLLDYPTLLAHVNYCDDAEMDLLAAGQASVVYCPRTHAYFGHPPHRWREMLARGINVAVGTDSCASSPNLNLVDDLRLLRRLAPEVPAETLWEMATLRAARAIRKDHEVGSLTPGKSADFALFIASGPDPLTQILETNCIPEEVWIGGRAVS